MFFPLWTWSILFFLTNSWLREKFISFNHCDSQQLWQSVNNRERFLQDLHVMQGLERCLWYTLQLVVVQLSGNRTPFSLPITISSLSNCSSIFVYTFQVFLQLRGQLIDFWGGVARIIIVLYSSMCFLYNFSYALIHITYLRIYQYGLKLCLN